MLFRVITLIITLFFSTTSWAASSDGNAAKQFVSDLGDKVIAIFEQNQDTASREAELTALFDKSIDAKWMGRFVMGKYWRQASPEQQNRFLKLYKEFLLINYLPHFRNYTGEKQQVSGLIDEGDGDYLVRTKIVRPNKSTPVNVDYRIHKTGSGSPFYIFDIVTEGVSVVTTHRSDFGSVIAREGIDGLIKRIETKVKSAK